MSQKMGVRPSEYYRIGDEVTAHFFDKAVVSFGIEVEADLEDYVKDEKKTKSIETKRQQRFSRWMGAKPKFRDPIKR